MKYGKRIKDEELTKGKTYKEYLEAAGISIRKVRRAYTFDKKESEDGEEEEIKQNPYRKFNLEG